MTPCLECLPQLEDEYFGILGVYLDVRNQLIFAPNGKPIDIDIKAVEVAMKYSDIPENKKSECFKLVLDLARHFIREALA